MKTVEVDAESLRELLQAMLGPAHHVMELWATKGLPGSAVSTLVEQFNAQAAATKETA